MKLLNFACHGKNQEYYPNRIEDGAYIRMRASVISKNTEIILEGAICWEGCSYWSLQPCKQKYSRRRINSWYSMQNHGERGCFRDEVLAV